MTDKRILILNDRKDVGHAYAPFADDLGETDHSSISFTMNPNRYSLVVFTGGSDVSPSLYKDTSPKGACSCDIERDREEEKIFKLAHANNIAMFGICRGLQFLNVMLGGKLLHDLLNHGYGEHLVATSDSENFPTNSYHHQSCIPPIKSEILAWSMEKLSDRYIGDKDEIFNYQGPEVESLYFPRSRAAGVQWHPEALGVNVRGRTWAKHLARDLINCSPNGMQRLYLDETPKVIYAT